MKHLYTFNLLVFCLCTLGSSYATNYTSIADGDLGNISNWDANGRPGTCNTTIGSTDTIFITTALTGTCGGGGYRINSGGVVIITSTGSLTITGKFTPNDGTELIIESGGSLSVSDDFRIGSDGQTTTINGDVYVGGDFDTRGNITIGSTATFVTDGMFGGPSTVNLTINGDVDANGGFQIYDTTLTVGSTGNLEVDGSFLIGNASLNNNGVIYLTDATSITDWDGNSDNDCDGDGGTGVIGFGGGAFCGSFCNTTSGGYCNDNGAPLPIELNYFEASLIGSNFVFDWETLTETNNDFFTIEYSTDLVDFYELLETEGAGTSLELISYSESVPAIYFENVIYFRLKQTDFDGKFEYSDIIAISSDSEFDTSINIFPNPTEGKAVLQVANTSLQTREAQILSPITLGVVEEFQIVDGEATIDLSKYDNGVYILQIPSLGKAHFKVVVQR